MKDLWTIFKANLKQIAPFPLWILGFCFAAFVVLPYVYDLISMGFNYLDAMGVPWPVSWAALVVALFLAGAMVATIADWRTSRTQAITIGDKTIGPRQEGRE